MGLISMGQIKDRAARTVGNDETHRNRTVLMVFLTAAGSLLVSIAFMWWMGGIVLENTRVLARQRVILQQLGQFVSTLKDVETSQRGFLLTGNEAYLEPYRQALAEIRDRLGDLRTLVSTGDLEEKPMERVGRLTDENLAELEETIRLRREKGLEAAQAAVMSNKGKWIMDKIRAEIARMHSQEEAEYQAAARRADKTITIRTVASILTALLNLAVLAWAWRRISLNIRQLQQAREEQESHARFPDENPDPILRVSDQGVLLYANRTSAALHEAGKLVAGRPAPAVLMPYLERAVGSKILVADDLEFGERTFAFTFVHFPDRRYSNVYARDITNRKRAETALAKKNEELAAAEEELRAQNDELLIAINALRESEERFRTMADAIPQLAWMAHGDGYIFWYNRQWYAYTGTTPEQMAGWGWQSVHNPDMLPRILERWKMAIASGDPFDMEFPLRGADGRFGWFLTRVLPLKNDQGVVVRWFGTNTDVTERKRMEEELRKAKDELEVRVRERTAELTEAVAELKRSNRDLEQFAHVSSHDLQEPLRMVTSFVQLLADQYKDKVDEAGKEYISFAVEGALRMRTLINDLLAYSRVNSQAQPFQPTNCEALLHDVLQNLALRLKETGAEVTHDPLPMVLGDRTQLAQVFQNLIENAMKFHSEKPPQVHIGVEQRDTEWLFYVRDNGIGIDPEYHEKIFIIFQRLHTRQHYPGNGIGLAIVKRIVERHGGTICVDSKPGEGSTFYFTIPINGRVAL